MKVYRIYKYDATVKIPRKDYNRNDCYTADEVEKIIMEDAFKGDCFLHDNVILKTEDKAEAEDKFESLTPYSELVDGGKIEVTCYGLEALECDEDEDEKSYGENWKFAEIVSEDEEE